MEEILKNIECLRREKGIKQTVIAEELGVKQNTYSQYITRSTDIPYSRLSRIADILKVSVVDIITYPVKYLPEQESCLKCIEKEVVIKNLNNYIGLLEKQLNKKLK